MRRTSVIRNLSFLTLFAAVVVTSQARAQASQWENCSDVQGLYCSSISLGHCGPYQYEPSDPCQEFTPTAASFMQAYALGNSLECYGWYREGDFQDQAYYTSYFIISSC